MIYAAGYSLQLTDNEKTLEFAASQPRQVHAWSALGSSQLICMLCDV